MKKKKKLTRSMNLRISGNLKGPTVFFLPSYPDTCDIFNDNLMEALRPHCRLVGLTIPGFDEELPFFRQYYERVQNAKQLERRSKNLHAQQRRESLGLYKSSSTCASSTASGVGGSKASAHCFQGQPLRQGPSELGRVSSSLHLPQEAQSKWGVLRTVLPPAAPPKIHEVKASNEGSPYKPSSFAYGGGSEGKEEDYFGELPGGGEASSDFFYSNAFVFRVSIEGLQLLRAPRLGYRWEDLVSLLEIAVDTAMETHNYQAAVPGGSPANSLSGSGPFLIAHGWGALLGYELLLRRPKLFSRVVMLDVGANIFETGEVERRLQFLYAFHPHHPPLQSGPTLTRNVWPQDWKERGGKASPSGFSAYEQCFCASCAPQWTPKQRGRAQRALMKRRWREELISASELRDKIQKRCANVASTECGQEGFSAPEHPSSTTHTASHQQKYHRYYHSYLKVFTDTSGALTRWWLRLCLFLIVFLTFCSPRPVANFLLRWLYRMAGRPVYFQDPGLRFTPENEALNHRLDLERWSHSATGVEPEAFDEYYFGSTGDYFNAPPHHSSRQGWQIVLIPFVVADAGGGGAAVAVGGGARAYDEFRTLTPLSGSSRFGGRNGCTPTHTRMTRYGDGSVDGEGGFFGSAGEESLGKLRMDGLSPRRPSHRGRHRRGLASDFVDEKQAPPAEELGAPYRLSSLTTPTASPASFPWPPHAGGAASTVTRSPSFRSPTPSKKFHNEASPLVKIVKRGYSRRITPQAMELLNTVDEPISPHFSAYRPAAEKRIFPDILPNEVRKTPGDRASHTTSTAGAARVVYQKTEVVYKAFYLPPSSVVVRSPNVSTSHSFPQFHQKSKSGGGVTSTFLNELPWFTRGSEDPLHSPETEDEESLSAQWCRGGEGGTSSKKRRWKDDLFSSRFSTKFKPLWTGLPSSASPALSIGMVKVERRMNWLILRYVCGVLLSHLFSALGNWDSPLSSGQRGSTSRPAKELLKASAKKTSEKKKKKKKHTGHPHDNGDDSDSGWGCSEEFPTFTPRQEMHSPLATQRFFLPPQVPVLFLYGSSKYCMLHSREWVEYVEYRGLMEDGLSRVIRVDGGGHWFFAEASHSAEVASAVIDFLL